MQLFSIYIHSLASFHKCGGAHALGLISSHHLIGFIKIIELMPILLSLFICVDAFLTRKVRISKGINRISVLLSSDPADPPPFKKGYNRSKAPSNSILPSRPTVDQITICQ